MSPEVFWLTLIKELILLIFYLGATFLFARYLLQKLIYRNYPWTNSNLLNSTIIDLINASLIAVANFLLGWSLIRYFDSLIITELIYYFSGILWLFLGPISIWSNYQFQQKMPDLLLAKEQRIKQNQLYHSLKKEKNKLS